MKAVILAAGYGTRLQPLTERVPKPLLPVAGIPLLHHIITKLAGSTVTGFGINAHHKAEALQEYVGREFPDIDIVLSRETSIMGSGGGIAGLRAYLASDEYFLVHNGDILSDIDIAGALKRFQDERPLCGLVVHDVPWANNVCVAADGRVVDLRGKLAPAVACRQRAYSGIAFMRSDIFGHIPAGASDIIDVLLNVIAGGKERVLAIDARGCNWCDIGSPRYYLDAHAAILLRRVPLLPCGHMPPGPFCLGDGCVVENDVQMDGFVSAGRSVRIGRGARLSNCVLWDHARVEDGRQLADAVVGPGWMVPVLVSEKRAGA